MKIEFGDIIIEEVKNDWNDKSQAIAKKRCYRITIIGEGITNLCYCDNIDKVILYALELKHEGYNGNFAEYAGAMLRIGNDAELWR